MRATVFHAGRHLSDPELLAPHDRCPLCDAEGSRPLVQRIQEGPRVDLLRCPRCRGASASRMPLGEVLDRYYADYYSGKDAKVTTPDTRRLSGSIVRPLQAPAAGAAMRVLDFGGGDGSIGVGAAELLIAAGAAAVEVTVIDYEAPAPGPVPAISMIGRRELDDGVDGPFDLVIASAVLEHVPEFRPLFLRLFGLLGPGGAMYVRTPWLAPFRRVPGGVDLTFPAHVHDLGGDFWNRAAPTFGLDAEVLRSGPSPVEADPRAHPLRAGVAAVLKVPARAEARLGRREPRDPRWKWVGGWEVVLRRRSTLTQPRGAGRSRSAGTGSRAGRTR